MKRLAILFAGFLGGCQSLWGSLNVPNPDNCVSNPTLCLADEVCDLQEQICHPALALYAVTPKSVPTSGSGSVKLLGERFLEGIQVDWQGVAISDVKLVSSTELTFTLPMSQQSSWWTPITVRNPTGHSVQREDLFSYYSESLNFSAVLRTISQNPRRMAVGDWNHDGRMDVAYTCSSESVLILLPGKGDGTLGTPELTSLGTSTQKPQDLLAIDADGDSKLDLIVAVLDGVQTLRGDGKGGLVPGPSMKTGTIPSLLALVRQPDNDKRTLVVSDNTDKTLSLVALRKDGSYETPQVIATSIFPTELSAGDITGDGFDEVFAMESPLLWVFKRNGLGGYSAEVLPTPGCAAQGMSLADLNFDGRLDLVVSCNKGLLTFRNQAGTLVPDTLLLSARSPSAHLLATDLSGDGWPDIVFGDTVALSTFALLADRQGGYLPPTLVTTDSADSLFNSSLYAVSDFDGDHKPDLAIGNPSVSNPVKVIIATNRSP
jgi:hypothetical protein